jgi:transcriptional regulator with XRE-family HTH domain
MEPRIRTQLGKKVAETRKNKQVSLTDIAFQTGINKTITTKVENGEVVPIEELSRLLKFLGMTNEIAMLSNPIIMSRSSK